MRAWQDDPYDSPRRNPYRANDRPLPMTRGQKLWIAALLALVAVAWIVSGVAGGAP